MADIWSASSSIFNTIGTVANTASRSVNTLASGIDMIDTYVEAARTRQVDSTKIAMANYRDNLIKEAALEQSRKDKILQQEISSDTTLSKLFADNFTRLSALFEEPAVNP